MRKQSNPNERHFANKWLAFLKNISIMKEKKSNELFLIIVD